MADERRGRAGPGAGRWPRVKARASHVSNSVAWTTQVMRATSGPPSRVPARSAALLDTFDLLVGPGIESGPEVHCMAGAVARQTRCRDGTGWALAGYVGARDLARSGSWGAAPPL